MDYQEFIRAKIAVAEMGGFEVEAAETERNQVTLFDLVENQ